MNSVKKRILWDLFDRDDGSLEKELGYKLKDVKICGTCRYFQLEFDKSDVFCSCHVFSDGCSEEFYMGWEGINPNGYCKYYKRKEE